MPITSSAKKALRASKKKRVFNIRRNEAMKGAVKDVKKLAVANPPASGSAEVGKLLSSAYKAIDKAAKRGVIKKNAASRKKSRLTKLLARAKTA